MQQARQFPSSLEIIVNHKEMIAVRFDEIVCALSDGTIFHTIYCLCSETQYLRIAALSGALGPQQANNNDRKCAGIIGSVSPGHRSWAEKCVTNPVLFWGFSNRGDVDTRCSCRADPICIDMRPSRHQVFIWFRRLSFRGCSGNLPESD